MKKLQFSALFLSLIVTVMLFPHFGSANTVDLSVSSVGSDSVRLIVNGENNYSVNLFYRPNSSSGNISLGSIGTTDSSGYFSTTIRNGNYNISSGDRVYVEVNGQQSNTVTWPSSNNNGDQITFSQNNIDLNSNDSITVDIYGGSGSYYISSNSNTSFVNASIRGNQIYLSSYNNSQYRSGSATIRVCSNNGNSICGYLYVNQNGNNNQQISFSQNNISLNVGQQIQITIYGYGSGSYYISNDYNSNVVDSYLNGNTLNLTGRQSGATTVKVCSNNSNSNCGSLYVNVNNNNGGYYNNNGYYNNPTVTYVQSPGTPIYTQPSYTGLGTPSAGVYLSTVPRTGISLSLKMMLFFVGLFMWSAFSAFMILLIQEEKRAY